MRSFIILAAACLALTAHASEEKKIVCYFGSWSVYRPGEGRFAIENVQPNLCTHLIYTFVGLVDNHVKVLDAWQDLPDNWGKDGFGRFNKLRELSPKTKTLVAIGGWNEGSAKYSKMASSAHSRHAFVKNVVAFVKKYDFDGFDLDWEYPAQRGGAPSDVQNFVALIKEMREAFDEEGLLLTAAVGAAKSSASQSYNIPEVSKYLHFINLMTYDLHGSWESVTGINAPLHAGASDTGLSADLTVDAAVKYWLSCGVDPKKLIVGVASYGRTFTLANPANHGVGAPTTGPGAAGPYTREPGFLGYNEICHSPHWTHVWDGERCAPYAYHGNQWVGYDNVRSIKEKAEYVKKMGLGGAMVWSIETDDFRGKCGEPFPLIKTLVHVLCGGPAVSEHPPPTHPPTTTPASGGYTSPRPSPTTGSGGYTTPRPTSTTGSGGYTTPRPTPTTGSGGYTTPRPTPTTGSGGYTTPRPTPTTGSGGYTTPRPTPTTGSGGYTTRPPSPTTGSGSYTTARPSYGSGESEPTVEVFPDDGECDGAGNIADPDDSSRFYMCMPDGEGGYSRVVIICPDPLYYNAAAGICDWKPKGHY